MIETLVASGFLIAFAACAYGWGTLVLRGTVGSIRPTAAFTVALGLAILAPIGGIANLAGLATAPILYAIFALGLVLAAPALVRLVMGRDRPSRRQAERPAHAWFLVELPRAVTVLFIVAAVAFLAVSLLPSLGFNQYDDYRFYLVRPVRMLATGSMAGDPFDPLLLDSLGAQTFFHGFILLGFSLDYLNGFDGIFCFALGMVLIVELGRRYAVEWWFILFAVLIFGVIHPQVVNIGAVYSGSLMIITLMYSLALLSDRIVARETVPVWWWLVLVALPLGALVSFKNTYVLFAAPFMAVYCGWLMASRSTRRPAIVATLAIAGGALLSILPWLALHATKILAMLAPAQFPEEARTEGLRSVPVGGGFTELFSGHDHFYGGSFSDYLFAVAFVAVAGLLAILLISRSGDKTGTARLYPVAAASVATVTAFFAIAAIMGAKTGVRYAAPVLIGVLPVAVALMSRYCGPLGEALLREASVLRRVNIFGLVLLTMQVFLVSAFSETSATRISRASAYRTLISFPISPEYLDYHRQSVGPEARAATLRTQRMIPADEPLLAFMGTPFHLDFRRNPVTTISEWGLTGPWLDVPFYQGIEALRRYLRGRQLRYVIWEYDHWGAVDRSVYELYKTSPIGAFRKFALRNLDFWDTLDRLARKNVKIFDDGHMMILDLGPQPPNGGDEPRPAGESDDT